MSVDDSRLPQRDGYVNFAEWAGYAWKNELLEQRARVLLHLKEIFEEHETQHNPFHMLERAFGITAFCMRRLIECHLVTDRFRETELTIYQIPIAENVERREHFRRFTGGNFYNNYSMTVREPRKRKPKYISDKFLHARIIATLSDSEHLPNGLLVASDHQAKENLFHMTESEFDSMVWAFLNDTVHSEADGYDAETGKVYARRD